MQMIEIEKEGYRFCAKPYDWTLGIAVEIEIYKGSQKIGGVRLLSAEHEEKFEKIEGLPLEDLLKGALEGFVSNKTKTSTDKVLEWQRKIQEMGHNYVSPIYANLASCF